MQISSLTIFFFLILNKNVVKFFYNILKNIIKYEKKLLINIIFVTFYQISYSSCSQDFSNMRYTSYLIKCHKNILIIFIYFWKYFFKC